jgi:hypothetical protein
MKKSEAIRMYKFIIYFNKEYTRNFVDFIESNKEVAVRLPLSRSIETSNTAKLS